jgi:hypothetical protein
VRKPSKIAIVVIIAAVVNYFVIQAVLAIPCDSQASCNQRLAGLFIVAGSDVFATVIAASELGKKR